MTTTNTINGTTTTSNTKIANAFGNRICQNPTQLMIDLGRMSRTELKGFLKTAEIDLTGIKGDKSLALARYTLRNFFRSMGIEVTGWNFEADLAILNDEFPSYVDRFEYMANRKYR